MGISRWSDWSYWVFNNFKINMKKGLSEIAILVIVVLFIGGAALAAPFIKLVMLPWFKFGTKVNTNQEIIQKTYDANNVIYNYEWFKERYEAISAIDVKIDNAQIAKDSFEKSAGARSSWTFEDKTEDSRLGAVVLGLQNQKQDLVAEYNARAKMANRNIFQNNLPLFIDLN